MPVKSRTMHRHLSILPKVIQLLSGVTGIRIWNLERDSFLMLSVEFGISLPCESITRPVIRLLPAVWPLN